MGFYFRMGCILVLFQFFWFSLFWFWNLISSIFLFSKLAILAYFDIGLLWYWPTLILAYFDIGLLWSKITIFIIEISLKLLLHTKYEWNNPNSRRLGLKSPNFNFLPFLAVQEFITHTNILIHVTGSIFIDFFFKCS